MLRLYNYTHSNKINLKIMNENNVKDVQLHLFMAVHKLSQITLDTIQENLSLISPPAKPLLKKKKKEQRGREEGGRGGGGGAVWIGTPPMNK